MDSPLITLAADGPIATITLDRPEKLNALNPTMLNQLELAIAELEANREVRAVIITGAGDRAFCVGADINAWAALDPIEMWASWTVAGHRIFERLARLRQPVIAALNGFTLGGGLELALAADLRIASEHVELGQPEVKLAAIPGWAGTQRLPALIGPARAKQMIFTGTRVDAVTAEKWGLVNEVVGRGLAGDRARTIAAAIADNAPIAVQLAKQLIDGGTGQAVSVALESIAGALTAGTDDGREGIAAFRERREPRFRGFGGPG